MLKKKTLSFRQYFIEESEENLFVNLYLIFYSINSINNAKYLLFIRLECIMKRLHTCAAVIFWFWL